jgi:hypothetical protein
MSGTHARLQDVLQYLQLPRDAVPALHAALPGLAECIDALYPRLSPFGAPIATRIRVPAFFQRGLPEFLRTSLRGVSVSDGNLDCVLDQAGQAPTLQQLERGAALVRHVDDFLGDIAQWADQGDAWRPNDAQFVLYPACDVEQKQAFWQGHQDQVLPSPLYTLAHVCKVLIGKTLSML